MALLWFVFGSRLAFVCLWFCCFLAVVLILCGSCLALSCSMSGMCLAFCGSSFAVIRSLSGAVVTLIVLVWPFFIWILCCCCWFFLSSDVVIGWHFCGFSCALPWLLFGFSADIGVCVWLMLGLHVAIMWHFVCELFFGSFSALLSLVFLWFGSLSTCVLLFAGPCLSNVYI